MQSRFLLILISIFFINASKIDNIYSIVGEQTYLEVLTAINAGSKRSVLGSDDILKRPRSWMIKEKNYFQCIEHVKKNALSDGYNLFYSSEYVFFMPVDPDKEKEKESGKIEKDSVYMYKSSFSGLTKETKSYSEFLNYPIYDSIENTKEKKYYNVSIEVLGFTTDFIKDIGLNLSDPLLRLTHEKQAIQSLKQILYFIQFPEIQLKLNASDKRLNFYRTLNFQISSDSLYNIRFGDEIRRQQTINQTNGIITTNYESVYTGLRIALKDSLYSVNYRISDTELSTHGKVGFPIKATSNFSDNQKYYLYKGKKIKIPLRKRQQDQEFNLILNVAMSTI